MADDNISPIPQSAIPPKAVPPQVRPAGEGGADADAPTVRRQPVPPAGGTPMSAPRTVRLKSVGIGGAPGSAAAAVRPPVTPSAPAGTEEAAAAIKRMTTRIAMMAGETDPATGKKITGRITAVPPGEIKRATAPLAMEGESTVKKVTSRIQMPAVTAPIPAMGDVPKTIKIRPMSGTQPVAGAPSGSAVEMPAVVGQTAAQLAAGKSKTSRIPLESAMSVPQQGGGGADGGAPKTIKLKRPGEMSTIKVSVLGAAGAPTAGPAEAASDNASITQKKTIRVKRPMAPAASVAEGEGAGDPSLGAPMVNAAFPPVAYVPERGLGWFIALAVACILVALGVAGVFSTQLFGWPLNTQLDSQFQKG